MMAIANLQYAWTLFTKPIQAHLHVSLAVVQGIFAAFILVETWLVPFEGGSIDRSVRASCWVWAGSWSASAGWDPAMPRRCASLYLWYMLGGIGAGFIYGGPSATP